MNELYFYEYVDRKADDVVALLKERREEIFQAATRRAAEKTGEMLSLLHVNVAGLEVGKEVVIQLGEPVEEANVVLFPVSWKAATQDWLFPSMQGNIEVTALDNVTPLCQLALRGHYRPPAGVVGALGDALIGHRLAEATVRHFVIDLAERIASA